MSENANGVGDSAKAVGDQSGEQSKEQKATNPDLERALKDLHKFKAQAKELADKAQALEQEKLMAEGKKDELISQLQKQLNETKSKTSEMQKTFAWDKVQGWLKTKALADGFHNGNIEKFVSLADFSGRNPFRDDSTFQLEESVLSNVFDELKKEMPGFFGKPSPNVKDITPNGGAIETNGSDYSKMSLEQLKAHATKLSQRN